MVKDEVIKYLENHRGQIITGGKLARELKVSRTAIWKAIHALKDEGHDIESLPGSGYVLDPDSDGLSIAEIKKHLNTDFLGREIEVHGSIDSTNSYIKEGGIKHAEGFTVLADRQTAGRGRFGRSFTSPAHEGIYMSFLLKPSIPIDKITLLTVFAAVAVSRAVENVCGITTELKWVNDVFFNGKKLCGILSEAMLSAEVNMVDYAVVGIGINTNKVDKTLHDIATSIYEINQTKGIRNELIAEILNRFENLYLNIAEPSDILEEYSSRLFVIDKLVEAKWGEETLTGTVKGIDDTAALLLQGDDGEISRINSGEIKIKE